MKHSYRFNYTQELADGTVIADLDAEVWFRFTPGRPAQLYGPPENCYPAEAPEIDIYDVRMETSRKPGAYVQCPDEEVYQTLADYAEMEHFEDMCESAESDILYEAEEAAEHQAEVRRELRDMDT